MGGSHDAKPDVFVYVRCVMCLISVVNKSFINKKPNFAFTIYERLCKRCGIIVIISMFNHQQSSMGGLDYSKT